MQAAGPRRITAWDDEIHEFSLTNSSQTAINLMTNVADPEKRGCTLVRLIIDVVLFPATPGNASGRQIVSLGIGVVSDDAFAAGTLPDPEEESDYPVGGWVYRARKSVFDETLATGLVRPVLIEKDLRAMRKLDRSTLALIVHNGAVEGTAFTIGMSGLTRSLYKLP